MKSFLSTTCVLLLFSISCIYAQNPALSNPEITPNPLIEGEMGNMTMTFSNTLIPIPAGNGLTITVSFVGSMPTGAPTGTMAIYFNWVYNAGLNAYQGTQNQEIPAGLTTIGTITFNVNVTGPANGTAGFNANLGNVSGLVGNMMGDDQVGLTTSIQSAPLPIELLFFTGKKVHKIIQLDWQTANELNNSGFEVQKSADGIRWEIIDWVEGNGTTSDLSSYQLIDKAPYIGENYYRLNQIDFDSKNEYSKVVIIDNESSEIAINILPNPSNGKFIAVVANPNNEKMKISLYSRIGKFIWKSELLEDTSVWKKDFILHDKGMYFLSVQIGDEIHTKKIMIADGIRP